MDKLDTDIFNRLEKKWKMEPQGRTKLITPRIGYRAALKAEPKYRRRGNRSKWAYIPFGSNINPFFPQESKPKNHNTTAAPAPVEITVRDNIVSKSEKEIPAQKPFSVFAKYETDDVDFDPDFFVEDKKLTIPEGNSADAMIWDGISEVDALLIKIVSDPNLEYLGNMIVKRKLSAERILNFKERDWKQYGVNKCEDRRIIIKYLLLTGQDG